MDANTAILLVGLVINFVVMIMGGFKIMGVIVQYHIQNENRMATIEAEIKQLMRHNKLQVRAA